MTKSGKITKREENKQVRYLDDVFTNFRKEIENATKPWSTGLGLPFLFDLTERVPLCDLADRGDHYELHVEVPGIEKDKINVKATINAVEISTERSKESEEKRKDYVYSERSSSSFYRMIPVPEQIVPSKINAKVNNGILTIELPKNHSLKNQRTTRVEIK